MNNNSSTPDSHTADLLTYVVDKEENHIILLLFSSAVQYGFYDRVVQLIDVNPSLASTPLNDNITLLHWAAINNRIEVAKYLINKGAHIDAIGGALKATPLNWAIRDGKLEMVVFLLSHHAQPSIVDGEGTYIRKGFPQSFPLCLIRIFLHTRC